MGTKGSVGRSLGERHPDGTGGGGRGDKESAEQEGLMKGGSPAVGRSLGQRHTEATGGDEAGKAPRASATGHQGQYGGRGREKVRGK
jgi:hypothetical protein